MQIVVLWFFEIIWNCVLSINSNASKKKSVEFTYRLEFLDEFHRQFAPNTS